MSMIKSLTTAQMEQIPAYVDKWRKMALCTKPTDEDKASAAINALYDYAGLARPSHILYLKSPLGCLLAKDGMERLIKVKKSGSIHRLWDKVKDRRAKWLNSGRTEVVHDAYLDVVKTLGRVASHSSILQDLGEGGTGFVLMDGIENYMNRRLCVNIERATLKTIETEFSWNGMSENEKEQFLYAAVKETLSGHSFRGHGTCSPFISHETIGVLEYCSNELGIKYSEGIQPLIDVTLECEWLMPYENACFVSCKPQAIHMDERNRWHKFGHKAVEYGDGFGIWAINGVQMPEKFASEMPENWKSKWLLETYNAEQRRVIIGVIGYSKIMRELGAKQIHSDGDMSLHKIKKDVDIEVIYLLKVKCPSTGTSYALRVPPHVRTCEEARMALMRNSKGNYAFAKET